MNEFPLLVTDRLTLRQVQHADAQGMLAVRGDVEVTRLMGRDPLENLEQSHQQIATHLAEGKALVPSFRWALERKDDKTFLGTCGVFGWVKPWRKCSIGYEIGRFAWGQGYMQEAARAVLDWSFSNMALHRVDALIHPDNLASLKLAYRLGFQVEGRLRETAFWNNRHHDMLQLGLLQPEWRL